jgi:hypothetical protein
MEPAGALLFPDLGRRWGVVRINGAGIVIASREADDLALINIDRGIEVHGITTG